MIMKTATAIVSFLLTFLLSVQGASWPTVSLVYPPNGIILAGVGTSTNITFKIDGDPFPRIRQWFKGSTELTSTSNINLDESGGAYQSLKINSVTRGDEGSYYFITGDEGTQEKTKSPSVKVKVTFLEDQFTVNNQVVRASVGNYAVLQCFPPKHFGSNIRFSWSKDGALLKESDRVYISEYGNLVLLQVGYNDRSDSYRCNIEIASLKEGTRSKQGPVVKLLIENSSPSYLQPVIALKPRSLEVDSQVKSRYRMECVANGYPDLPNVKWYHNNKLLTSSSIVFDIQKRHYLQVTITRSGESAQGDYRCEAEDNTGISATAFATLDAITKPIITSGLSEKEIKKASGASLVLNCEATGSPKPQFSWIKNAVDLTSDDNVIIKDGSLTISKLGLLNKGVYQCKAYNKQGGAMSTGKLTVQERLAFAVRPEDMEVFIGMSATFNCMGKGDPGPSSLRWQFNGGSPLDSHVSSNDIANQATYIVPKVAVTDAGSVTCIIESPNNLFSQDEATATLTIRKGPQVVPQNTNITEQENDEATLVCLVHNHKNPTWKWLFKGILVSEPDSQRITINNGLMQIRQLTAADEGMYTCQADEEGYANSGNIYLTVKTKPSISINPEIRIGEGDTAKLTCTVTGNPSPTISWMFKNQNIFNGGRYRIDGTTSGTSVLQVTNVNKATDVGKWVCSAKNDLGRSSQFLTLTVVGICEVMEVPKNTTLKYQETLTLFCTVNKCPTAIWTWSKDGRPLPTNDPRYQLFNDKVEISRVQPSDAGLYECTVNSNNFLNKVETYTATITVEVPATIYNFPQGGRVLFRNNQMVQLICSAHGEYEEGAPVEVVWYRGNVVKESSKEVRTDTAQKISYVTQRLTIPQATASHMGHYQCTATNKFKIEDKKDVTLMLMTVPDKPNQPYSVWSGAGVLELVWSEPDNTGNTPLTSYEIEIEKKGDNLFRPFLRNLPPDRVNCIVYFLSSNQNYRFRVTAVNEIGRGDHSIESTNIRTFENLNGDTLNFVPTFNVEAVNSDSVLVTWKMPNVRTDDLVGYKIVYRAENELDNPQFFNVTDKTVTEATVTGLKAGTEYSIQVESNTGVSTGLLVSSVKRVRTYSQRPGPPGDCEADRQSAGRIFVSWQEPASTNGKIVKYGIHYRDNRDKDSMWSSLSQDDAEQTNFALTVFDESADYHVQVSAYNAAGEGEAVMCVMTGKVVNPVITKQWWFYLLLVIAILFLIALIVLCCICCYRNGVFAGCCKGGSSKPKMQPIPPVVVARESRWSRFKKRFQKKPKHHRLPTQDDFRTPHTQVYSPSMQRPNYYGGPNPNNTMMSYGKPAADFGDFYGKPPYNDDNNSYKKYNTYDSRGYNPSPGMYNQPPYNDTFNSRTSNRDNGYPTMNYGGSSNGGGGGGFKSSML